ncbi:hypothetical protein [Hafnia paralvei]|jgi:hypothetical protein|uniref:hypothetical protein n=1 Tax=Hafnia paralvei TaxID=546367 RepID=UPI001033DAB9|nr:hypothetical protein [Hafnia paralvei]TBM32118.1 hypothetical protein EYY85_01300 [Hafnia paralvei]
MDNSAYAKMIFKNNEIIALALDKGITAFQRGMKKTVHQLSIGAERFTWYSAFFLISIRMSAKNCQVKISECWFVLPIFYKQGLYC